MEKLFKAVFLKEYVQIMGNLGEVKLKNLQTVIRVTNLTVFLIFIHAVSQCKFLCNAVGIKKTVPKVPKVASPFIMKIAHFFNYLS